jgi:predicted AAA+ superfamily ATPase
MPESADGVHVEYRPRILDTDLARALEAAGAVVIEGPKACGKTETARQQARSEIRIDTPAAHQAFAVSPDLVLEGDTPRLLDEWQTELDLWNVVRHAVDDRQDKGQFILTGSAVPRDDITRHPGAGRFLTLRMRPMTLDELGFSTRAVSLRGVLAGEPVSSPEPGLSVPGIAERLVIGGWPGHLGLTSAQALRAMRGYLEDICRVDVPRIEGARRDPSGVRRVINSLARNVATEASLEAIAADAGGADRNMKVETTRGYLAALVRLMISDDVPAWDPAIRSRSRARSSAVRHLADPALATAAMNASPKRVLGDLNWMGLLFESMVIRDLRVYAATLGGEVFHYRDNTGLEADAIIELPDGDWAAFEIKLGSAPDVIDSAAQALLKLRDRVAMKPPRALGVITGTGFGLSHANGVHQIPIAALTA